MLNKKSKELRRWTVVSLAKTGYVRVVTFQMKPIIKICLLPCHNINYLCLIHTNFRVRENGCLREKDKYLNNFFYYNFDRYVKYVILVND